MNICSETILSIIFLSSGIIIIIGEKFVLITKSLDKEFKHPLFNNAIMFLAEMSALIVYYFFFKKEYENEKLSEENKDKVEIEKYKLIIPAILDLLSCFFGTLSLVLLPISINQMLNGSTLIVFMLSIFCLKTKFNINNYIGIPMFIIGLFIIGISDYLNTKNEEGNIEQSRLNTILGIILLLIRDFFTSCQTITEEYFMKTKICHPLVCIGVEGIFGFFINLILYIGLSFVKCNNFNITIKENLCTVDNKNNYYIENIFFTFEQLINSFKLIILTISMYFLLIIFNCTYVSLTKVANATTTVIVYNLAAFFVWLICLLPFMPKEILETFQYLQGIGFAILTIGVLFYNEIIDIQKNKKIIDTNENNVIKDEDGNKKSIIELFNNSNIEN